MALSACIRKFPRAGWDAIESATSKIIATTKKDTTIETMACQIMHVHQQFERYIERRFRPGDNVSALVGLGEPQEHRSKLMTATVSDHQKPASQLIEFGLIVEMTDVECADLQSWRDCGRDPDSGMRLIRWGWWEIEKAARGDVPATGD